jgi:methylmalonyl-CoA/ethylmalonyl-CoA epimerase
MVTTPFSVGEIGQVNVTVRDIEKGVSFYRENLGIRLLHAGPRTALCECNGTRLLLSLANKSRGQKRSVIYFKVDDIHVSAGTLEKNGVQVVAQPKIAVEIPHYTLWMAFFRDPDDNLLVLISENVCP